MIPGKHYSQKRSKPDLLRFIRGHYSLIGFVIFFFMFVAGNSGFYAQFRLWQQGRHLKDAIELERKKKIWMQKEIENLTHDQDRIKSEAQKEQSLGEPDEIIVKIR